MHSSDDVGHGDGGSAATENRSTSLEKVKQLLKAKDDTSRFVGLALLKSVLDNSPELQSDEGTITSLWNSISPKFLNRLLRTGSQEAGSDDKNSKDMLDLAVAVLHTFAILLPSEAKQDSRLLNRIPKLTTAVLYRCVHPFIPLYRKNKLTRPLAPRRHPTSSLKHYSLLLAFPREQRYSLDLRLTIGYP